MRTEIKAPQDVLLDLPQERITGDILRGRGPRRGNLEALLRYWRPIMKKPGGFRRCLVILANHPELYPLERICAWLHHETTGKWPNEGKGKKGKKKRKRRGRKLTRSVRRARRRKKSVDFGEDIIEISAMRLAIRESRDIGGVLVQPIAGRESAVELKAAMFRQYSTTIPVQGEIEVKKRGLIGSRGRTGQAIQGVGSFLLPGDFSDIRSPIRSQIYETLTPGGGRDRIPSARRLLRGPSRGARNKFRCPPGFEKGGTFTNREFTTCGAQILGIPSSGPGSPNADAQRALARLARSADLVREIGDLRKNRSAYDIIRAAQIPVAPKKGSPTRRQTSVDLVLARINDEDFGTRFVRRDGVILEPVASLQTLGGMNEFDDMVDGSLVDRWTRGQIGSDLVPAFGAGLRDVYVGIPETSVVVKVSRVGGELTPAEINTVQRTFPTSLRRAADLPDPSAAIYNLEEITNGRFKVEIGDLQGNRFREAPKSKNERIRVRSGRQTLMVPRWVYDTFLSRSAPRRAKGDPIFEIVDGDSKKSITPYMISTKSVVHTMQKTSSYHDTIEVRAALFADTVDDANVEVKKLGRRLRRGLTPNVSPRQGGRARAIFDPNINGFRCPPGTRNAGQFSDEMGRNCGFSLPRKIVNEMVDLGMRIEDAMDRRKRRREERGSIRKRLGAAYREKLANAQEGLANVMRKLADVLDVTEDRGDGRIGQTIAQTRRRGNLTPEQRELLNGRELADAIENMKRVLDERDFDDADISDIRKAYQQIEKAAQLEAGRLTDNPARTGDDRTIGQRILDAIKEMVRRLADLISPDADRRERRARRDQRRRDRGVPVDELLPEIDGGRGGPRDRRRIPGGGVPVDGLLPGGAPRDGARPRRPRPGDPDFLPPYDSSQNIPGYGRIPPNLRPSAGVPLELPDDARFIYNENGDLVDARNGRIVARFDNQANRLAKYSDEELLEILRDDERPFQDQDAFPFDLRQISQEDLIRLNGLIESNDDLDESNFRVQDVLLEVSRDRAGNRDRALPDRADLQNQRPLNINGEAVDAAEAVGNRGLRVGRRNRRTDVPELQEDLSEADRRRVISGAQREFNELTNYWARELGTSPNAFSERDIRRLLRRERRNGLASGDQRIRERRYRDWLELNEMLRNYDATDDKRNFDFNDYVGRLAPNRRESILNSLAPNRRRDRQPRQQGERRDGFEGFDGRSDFLNEPGQPPNPQQFADPSRFDNGIGPVIRDINGRDDGDRFEDLTDADIDMTVAAMEQELDDIRRRGIDDASFGDTYRAVTRLRMERAKRREVAARQQRNASRDVGAKDYEFPVTAADVEARDRDTILDELDFIIDEDLDNLQPEVLDAYLARLDKEWEAWGRDADGNVISRATEGSEFEASTIAKINAQRNRLRRYREANPESRRTVPPEVQANNAFSIAANADDARRVDIDAVVNQVLDFGMPDSKNVDDETLAIMHGRILRAIETGEIDRSNVAVQDALEMIRQENRRRGRIGPGGRELAVMPDSERQELADLINFYAIPDADGNLQGIELENASDDELSRIFFLLEQARNPVNDGWAEENIITPNEDFENWADRFDNIAINRATLDDIFNAVNREDQRRLGITLDSIQKGDLNDFGEGSAPDERSFRNVRNRFPRSGLPDQAYWRTDPQIDDTERAELDRRFGRYYDGNNQLTQRGRYVNARLRREREGKPDLTPEQEQNMKKALNTRQRKVYDDVMNADLSQYSDRELNDLVLPLINELWDENQERREELTDEQFILLDNARLKTVNENMRRIGHDVAPGTSEPSMQAYSNEAVNLINADRDALVGADPDARGYMNDQEFIENFLGATTYELGNMSDEKRDAISDRINAMYPLGDGDLDDNARDTRARMHNKLQLMNQAADANNGPLVSPGRVNDAHPDSLVAAVMGDEMEDIMMRRRSLDISNPSDLSDESLEALESRFANIQRALNEANGDVELGDTARRYAYENPRFQAAYEAIRNERLRRSGQEVQRVQAAESLQQTNSENTSLPARVVNRLSSFDWRGRRAKKRKQREEAINNLVAERINNGDYTAADLAKTKEEMAAMTPDELKAHLGKVFSVGIKQDMGTVEINGKTYTKRAYIEDVDDPGMVRDIESWIRNGGRGELRASFIVKGELVDEDGNVVADGSLGTLSRTLFKQRADGPTGVYHGMFTMDNTVSFDGELVSFKGGNFANNVNNNAFAFYQNAGINNVTLGAAWDGKAVWARFGFREDNSLIRGLNAEDSGTIATLVKNYDKYQEKVRAGRLAEISPAEVAAFAIVGDDLRRDRIDLMYQEAQNLTANEMPSMHDYLLALDPDDGDPLMPSGRNSAALNLFRYDRAENGSGSVRGLGYQMADEDVQALEDSLVDAGFTRGQAVTFIEDRERGLRANNTHGMMGNGNFEIGDFNINPPDDGGRAVEVSPANNALGGILDGPETSTPDGGQVNVRPGGPLDVVAQRIEAALGGPPNQPNSRPQATTAANVNRLQPNARVGAVADEVPIGANGVNTQQAATRRVRNGLDLSEVPDSFLANAIERTASTDPDDTNARFHDMGMLGGGEGVNGVRLYLDKTTGQKIGVKFGSNGNRPENRGPGEAKFYNEHSNEILGAAIAERLGFPQGQIRIGGDYAPQIDGVSPERARFGSRPLVIELGHNLGADTPAAHYPGIMDLVENTGDTPQEEADILKSFIALRLMDKITGNQDRHPYNFLIGNDGKVYPIDNGAAIGTAASEPWDSTLSYEQQLNEFLQFRSTVMYPEPLPGQRERLRDLNDLAPDVALGMIKDIQDGLKSRAAGNQDLRQIVEREIANLHPNVSTAQRERVREEMTGTMDRLQFVAEMRPEDLLSIMSGQRPTNVPPRFTVNIRS